MTNKINDYLKKFDLDLRKSHDGRFMDQKVTPDVLSFIADCIYNFVGNDKSKEFSVKDIWNSSYFINNVEVIFAKPSPKNETANHEYDKFIAQPIKTLHCAHILSDTKKGNKIYYSVKNMELLEYIGLKDRYAYNFLVIYLNKVLTDSGFIKSINNFISLAKSKKINRSSFDELKSKYQLFIRGNTPIKTDTEINRIFTKVLNIFSVENNIQGTLKGNLSDRTIYYYDLMYNRPNFRDLRKEKNISRQEARQTEIEPHSNYNEYLINKAIQRIKKKYSASEVRDEFSNGPAVHVHHIFPKNEFPDIARYLENLIKLTTEQHLTKAHPNGNTQIVSKDYQLICLLSKSESIEKSLSLGEFFYSKNDFIFVINSGLRLDRDEEFRNTFNFETIREKLKTEYKK